MAASLVFRLHDRGPELVREVLLERGWEEYDKRRRKEQDWNLYWRGSAFRTSEYHNLLPWQRLNHHPKTVGITRKDCLARNLRRMRATYGSALCDFSPVAFILPKDYTRFRAECNSRQQSGALSVYWICKPVDLSRGRGIFIFQSIKDLFYDCCVIVQRYISDPLLISGYKFDLRIYVCVKSFHPLTVYIHQEGLVRFATEKYDLASLQNLYAHLTNTSINKFGPFYKAAKEQVGRGCKWTMGQFRRFLHSKDLNQLLLWQRINNIVTLTLLTIAPSVPSCPNCLELFGFDILIDVRFKPWLLEVNYSPALTLDCQADITVKKGLVGDLIDLMNYTSVDGLREQAYQGRAHKSICFRENQPTCAPKPPSEVKGPKHGGPTLPQLRVSGRPDQRSHRPSRHLAFVNTYQRHLPPVDLNKTRAAKAGIINTDSAGTLNPILGPRSHGETRPAPVPRPLDAERPSEVTKHDDRRVETETGLPTQTDVSPPTPDTRQRGLGGKHPAGPRQLPNIYSGRLGPVGGAPAVCEHSVPPPRVGDFIRTFPFNAATLKASRQQLDVKAIVLELHRLTARLASCQPASRGAEGGAGGEVSGQDEREDIDSLFWGPEELPLIRNCLKTS